MMPPNNNLLAGCYDVEKRNQEILEKLYSGFQKIRVKNLHKQQQPTQVEVEVPQGPDAIFQRLLLDFQLLQREASSYNGIHNTTQYRRLQERCVKLELALDKLDVGGREDLRDRRRSILLDVNDISTKLAGRTHSHAKCCDDFEFSNKN